VAALQVIQRADKENISMKPDKKTWKSKGHYLKDGTEWDGNQHAHNGKIMTGKLHTESSKNLYHFMELSSISKKKVLSNKK
jgi:hypothetical protein